MKISWKFVGVAASPPPVCRTAAAAAVSSSVQIVTRWCFTAEAGWVGPTSRDIATKLTSFRKATIAYALLACDMSLSLSIIYSAYHINGRNIACYWRLWDCDTVLYMHSYKTSIKPYVVTLIKLRTCFISVVLGLDTVVAGELYYSFDDTAKA